MLKEKIIECLGDINFSRGNPDVFIKKILGKFEDSIYFEKWALLVFDRKTEHFEFLYTFRLEEEQKKEIENLIEDGIVDWTFEKKSPFFLPSEKNHDSSKNFLFIIPLQTDRGKIGAIIAWCRPGERFVKKEVLDVFTVFSTHIAVKVENYLLYQEFCQREKERPIMTKILQSIDPAREIEEVLRSVLELILQHTRSRYGFFLKVEEKKKVVLPWVSSGISPDIFNNLSFSLDKGVIGYVVSTGRPFMIDSFSEVISPSKSDEFKPLKPQNLLVVPLKIRKNEMAILVLCTTLDRSFYTVEDFNFLLGVANIITITIKNKLLYGELRESFRGTIRALINAIEAKDPYTLGHSRRVTFYSLKVANSLGLPEKEKRMLEFCVPLHDIGKIGITDRILRKPSQLTSQEYEVIKQHPVIGEKIVKGIRFLKPGLSIIRNHHERYDGKGYPDNLKGNDIPFLARIVSVADAFDAMTSHRPHRKKMKYKDALRELERNAGYQFDPQVVEVFCRIFKPYK